MSKRSVICEAVRTPIGKFQGGLAGVRAPELALARRPKPRRRSKLPSPCTTTASATIQVKYRPT